MKKKTKPKKPKQFPDIRVRRRMYSMRKSGMFPETLSKLETKYGEIMKKAGY